MGGNEWYGVMFRDSSGHEFRWGRIRGDGSNGEYAKNGDWENFKRGGKSGRRGYSILRMLT